MKGTSVSLSAAINLVLLHELKESTASISVCGFFTVFFQGLSFNPGVWFQQILHPAQRSGERSKWESITLILWLWVIFDCTYIPSESVVWPSLPMMRYSFPSSSWPLHWSLLANTRMEPFFTETSSSDRQRIISAVIKGCDLIIFDPTWFDSVHFDAASIIC